MNSVDFFELSDIERKNKSIYLADRDKTLFSPLRFDEFDRVASHEKEHERLRSFYQETSSENKGLTITRNKLYESTDIYVSTHPRYSYPILHNHDFVELIYVMSGSCINYIEGKAVTMEEGDLCFMAPSTIHALFSMNDRNVIFNILMWEDSFSKYFPTILNRNDAVANFLKKISLSTNSIPYMIFKTKDSSLILQNIIDCYEEFNHKRYRYNDLIGLKVNEISIELCRNFSDLVMYGEPSKEKSEAFIYPILSLIETNYQTITLKELANIFSYSETYLSKLIKQETGKNFKDIIEEARISEAKYLILNTSYTMTEISQRVGYFDSSHMSRAFVKHLGLPPKKWSLNKSK